MQRLICKEADSVCPAAARLLWPVTGTPPQPRLAVQSVPLLRLDQHDPVRSRSSRSRSRPRPWPAKRKPDHSREAVNHEGCDWRRVGRCAVDRCSILARSHEAAHGRLVAVGCDSERGCGDARNSPSGRRPPRQPSPRTVPRAARLQPCCPRQSLQRLIERSVAAIGCTAGRHCR